MSGIHGLVRYASPRLAVLAVTMAGWAAVLADDDRPRAPTLLTLAQIDADGRLTDRQVLRVGADAPDLVRVGRDVYLLCRLHDASAPAGGVLAMARSGDAGQSWTRAWPVRIRTAAGQAVTPTSGSLLHAGGGRLGLYYFEAEPAGRGGGERKVRVAWSNDGVRYTQDPRLNLRLPPSVPDRPTVVRVGPRVHLFAGVRAPGDAQSGPGARIIRHLTSRNGAYFRAVRNCSVSAPVRLSDVHVRQGEAWALLSTPEGTQRTTIGASGGWRLADTAWIPGAWDAVTVALADGSELVAFCSRAVDTENDRGPLLEPAASDASWASAMPPLADDVATADDAAELIDIDSNAGAVGGGRVASDDAVGDDPLHDGTVASGQAGRLLGAAGAEGLLDEMLYPADGGFAPLPDFAGRTDYVEWYLRLQPPVDGPNAADAYRALMPLDPVAEAAWPEFKDMLNDGTFTGPQTPWDPDEHPEWEASWQATADVLRAYRDATRLEDYAPPVEFSDGPGEEDEPLLLLGLKLPTLRYHRQLAKATLSNAWRMEDGKVPAEQMTDAWETALNGANHLNGRPTLIENLVGTSMANLAHDHALQALDAGVFDNPADLEKAITTLERVDTPPPDLTVGIRGEHTFAMDIVQHLFTPDETTDEPAFNRRRAEKVMNWLDSPEDHFDELASLSPAAIHDATHALDTYYRELETAAATGYPDVRGGDLDALAEEMIENHAATRSIVPALGRYYRLRARSEAQRRATRLTFEVHRFRAEQGRWPTTLDELSLVPGSASRTDPFTGDDFGYRLGSAGPRIYSRSENGIDDGGVHSQRWDDSPDAATGSDDHVFWPPRGR